MEKPDRDPGELVFTRWGHKVLENFKEDAAKRGPQSKGPASLGLRLALGILLRPDPATGAGDTAERKHS